MQQQIRLFIPFSFAFYLLLFFHSASLHAQVVLNEYSCANRNHFADGFGAFEDWIELYNPGPAPVNLTGWSLSDNASKPTKWTFGGGTIPANGHLVVFASNRNLSVAPGPFHTNFKLTQTKNEPLLLSNPAGVLVDQVVIEPTQRDHARGRLTDGASVWGVFSTPTPNAANAGGMQDYTDKPVVSPAPGFYSGPVAVTLATPDPLASIRYTLDGSIPTAGSPLYAGPVNIATTQMLRARAFSSDPTVPPSFVETNTYFINVDNHNLPVISLGSADFQSVLFATKSEIISSFEYFDAGQTFRLETSGDMRGHGNDSWAFDQKGMRFHVRDQDGYTDAIYEKLFDATPRTEFPVLIIKASGSDNYPGDGDVLSCHLRDGYVQTISQSHGLELDERSYQSCVVFINGQYWGLYEMRERVDDDYTDFYYNQEEKDVDMLEYWGGLTVEQGSDTAWINLYNFMQSNDLSIAANYQHVTDRFEVMSLIDYFILNTYTVNTDWLNWNTSWWRGRKGAGKKWRYSLWDQDNTFNLGENYTGVTNPTFNNDPCDVENLPQFENAGPNEGHVDMFRWLFANPDFKNQYLLRYADLVNTTFRCDTMLAIFDRMVNHIAPEMPNQVARWGGSVAEWEDHLDSMRVQIQGRCAVVSEGLKDCYSLTGPFPMVMEVRPAGAGTVLLNTVNITAFPWSGDYYGNTTLNLLATAAPQYVFDHWEVKNNTLSAANTISANQLPVTAADTIVAVFRTIVSAGADVTICAGKSATLTATGGSGYSWSDLSGNTIGSGASVTVSPPTTTRYVVAVPSGRDTVTVNVKPLPVFSLGRDTLICATGGSIALSLPFPAGSVSWQDGSTGNAFTATGPGTYIATVTAAGCAASDTLVIGTAPASLFDLGPDIPVCPGNSTVLTAVSSFGPPTWQDGSVKMTFTAPDLGTYHAALNRYGCTYRDTVRVVLAEPLAVTLGPDRIQCPGDKSFTFVPQVEGGAPGAGTAYNWRTPGGTVLSAAPILTVVSDGIYIVEISRSGCTGSDSVSVIRDLLFEHDPAETANICQGDTVEITITMPGVTWRWDGGSQDNVPLEVSRDGAYGVTISHGACAIRDAFVFTSEDCPACFIYAPDAFSPNADDRNGEFAFAAGCSVAAWELHIVDRWGREVFVSTDFNTRWTAEGRPEGVYLYYYQATLTGEWNRPVPVTGSGHVTVIR